jgi:surface polysaccharide O-acyltransferase-like enzyme
MSNAAPLPDERRLSYDLLRILSVCGVVAIHTFGPTAANHDLEGTPSEFVARLMSTGFIWAVPVFVMLSGVLTLGERPHRDGVRSFYLRRARRILPALLVWNFVYLVLIRLLLLHEPLSGWQIVTEIVDARIYPHLYFLWLILGLYAVAPVLAAFLARLGARGTLWFASAILGVTVIVFMIPPVLSRVGVDREITLGALTFWLAYVGFFVMGSALGQRAFGWIPRAVAAAVGLAALAFVVAQALVPERFGALSAISRPDYHGLAIAILAIAVFVASGFLDALHAGERLRRVILALSEASFGVFLVHFVVLLLPYELLPGFHESRSVPQAFLAYLVILVVSFAISLFARRIPVVRAVF